RVLGRAVVESSKPREQNETPLERRQAAQLARAHGLWGQLEANTYRGSEPPTLTVRFTQRPHGSSTPNPLTVRGRNVTPQATFRPAGWGAALMLRTKPALDGSPRTSLFEDWWWMTRELAKEVPSKRLPEVSRRRTQRLPGDAGTLWWVDPQHTPKELTE